MIKKKINYLCSALLHVILIKSNIVKKIFFKFKQKLEYKNGNSQRKKNDSSIITRQYEATEAEYESEYSLNLINFIDKYNLQLIIVMSSENNKI